MTYDHLPNLICDQCGSDQIYSNGDSDCCIECGSHEYTDISEQPIEPSQLIADMFASWVPIFGGKQ